MKRKIKAILTLLLTLSFVLPTLVVSVFATQNGQDKANDEHTIIDNITSIGINIFDEAIIIENEIPLIAAPYVQFESWSLFNAASTLLIAVSTIVLICTSISKKNNSDATVKKLTNKNFSIALGSAAAATLLLITQDFTKPMAIFDRYSIVFAIFALLVITINTIGNVKEQTPEELEMDDEIFN